MMYSLNMKYEWNPEKNEWLKKEIIEGYVYLVPHIIEKNYIFLKTIIPNRKATKDYLKEQEEQDEI